MTCTRLAGHDGWHAAGGTVGVMAIWEPETVPTGLADRPTAMSDPVVALADSEVKLNEYDKTEWRDIYFHFKPEATEEEFEEAWASFCAAKHEYESERSRQ